MRYNVNQVIEKLKEIVKNNPKIGEATFGIATFNSDDDVWESAFDFLPFEEGYYETTNDFSIYEYIEEDEDENWNDDDD